VGDLFEGLYSVEGKRDIFSGKDFVLMRGMNHFYLGGERLSDPLSKF